MKYEKPEVVALGTAVENVHSAAKVGPHEDCAAQPTITTYESDE